MTALRFSAVVLAAGLSSRMGSQNKLLLPAGGEPIIRRVVRGVLAADPREVVVVTGFEATAVARAVSDLPVWLASNPHYGEGQMTSVAVGVEALTKPTDAIMICLGDMAWLAPADYRELVDVYASLTDKSIVVPHCRGRRGNPALLAASWIPELVSRPRNIGCRELIDSNAGAILNYEAAHDRFVLDIDTPEDYARMLTTIDEKTKAV
ncbi:MAG: nucleotidyltransferase family protein [Burkholderiales bacterium]